MDQKAQTAIEIIDERIEELHSIVEGATLDQDHRAAQERMRLWKTRTVELIAVHIHPDEAQELEEKRLTYSWMRQPLRNLKDQADMYRAYLSSLREELEKHPQGTLSARLVRETPPSTGETPPLSCSGEDAALLYMVKDLAARAGSAAAQVQSDGAVAKDRSYTHNAERYNRCVAEARKRFPRSGPLLTLPVRIEPIPSYRHGAAGFLSHEEVAKHTEVADLSRSLDMIVEALVGHQMAPPEVLETVAFDFILTPELRSIAERDKGELVVAYAKSLWKCTILLCGGIAEAMVCDRLQQRQEDALQKYEELWPKKKSLDLLEWDLYELTTVAAELDEITGDAQNMANLLRGWRNLVHPGKEARGETSPKREEADLAAHMVRLLARDLGQKSEVAPLD